MAEGHVRPHRPPHRHPVRVYYEDTDFSGLVYHANYLRLPGARPHRTAALRRGGPVHAARGRGRAGLRGAPPHDRLPAPPPGWDDELVGGDRHRHRARGVARPGAAHPAGATRCSSPAAVQVAAIAGGKPVRNPGRAAPRALRARTSHEPGLPDAPRRRRAPPPGGPAGPRRGRRRPRADLSHPSPTRTLRFVVCTADLRRETLRLFWKAPDGSPYESLSRLVDSAPKGSILAATNAGMYDPDLSPVGLFRPRTVGR